MVVDQFAAWVAKERLGTLPSDGGFARLQREGTYVKQIAYSYAITETAPGHASLFTGLPPHDHGIVANELLGPDGKGKASIVADTTKRRITVKGPVEGPGASVAALLKPVVADHFRERYGKVGYIAAISLKDRGIAFGAGKSGDLALWFDPGLGTFVASEAWNTAIPASLKPLIEPEAIARLEAEPWTPLDAAWLEQHAKVPDAAPGEGDLAGYGTVFPHVASQSQKPGHAFRAAPRTDRLLLDLGLKILDDEAKGRPTFLSISLSANDYVAHVFGPDSREAWDELRRLDASLAWFFAELDRRFGAQGWSLVLSADHGGVSVPEKARPPCGKSPIQAPMTCGVGHRLEASAVEARARAVAKAVLKDEKAIAGVGDPYIYLTPGARSMDAKTRAALAKALDVELKKIPGVLQVMDVSRFGETCPERSNESLDALVCRSVHAGVGGDFYVLPAPGSFFDPELVKSGGNSHGSPYGYDRFVPLFVRDPAHADMAGKVVDEPRPFSEYHDTLVRIIDAAAK